LLEPELADVARDRRLRHAAAGGAERIEELLLRRELPPADKAEDELLPVRLRDRPPNVHRPMFAAIKARRKTRHAAQGDVDRPLRRLRRRIDGRGTPFGVES